MHSVRDNGYTFFGSKCNRNKDPKQRKTSSLTMVLSVVMQNSGSPKMNFVLAKEVKNNIEG